MMGWGTPSRFVLTVCGALVATGCSQTQLAIHAIKELQRDEDSAPGYAPNGVPLGRGGIYKVGTPYVVNGVRYVPREEPDYDETGIASWYGPAFHNLLTANGETYDMNDLTAAHKTLPLPSYVRVTNLENGRALVLRVNDRGPFVNGRIIDVSRRAAQLLGFEAQGTAKVRVRAIAADDTFTIEQPVATAAEKGAAAAAPLASVEAKDLPPPPGVPESPPLPVVGPPPEVALEAVGPTDIYVQAGAFTRYDNASRLAAQLFAFGEVQIQPVTVNETEFFRVRMGPLRSVSEADVMLARLIDSGYPESRIVVHSR